jgi:hypothetical protein
MKKLMLLLFFTFGMNAQDNAIYKPNSEIVNAEASIILPIGNLSNKFDYAQSYGFWFKLIEHNGYAANIGFNLLFLNKAKPVNYIFNDSVHVIASNKLGFDIGARAMKTLPVSSNKHHYVEAGFTCGIHYLDYRFPKEEEEKVDEKGQEPAASAINIVIIVAPEMRYFYKNVGVKLQFRYTPYQMVHDFDRDFGTSSISLGIVYKQ